MENNFRVMRFVFLIVVASIFSAMYWQPAQAAACQSVMSGDWFLASTWTNCNSSFPTNGDSAQILNGHTITLDADLIGHALTGITVDSGGELQTSGDFDLNAHSLIIDGTFRLNASGVVFNGSFSYGVNGTLEFANNASSFLLDNSHVFWPSTNSPVNITVSGGSSGGLDLNNLTRTVSGVFQTNGPVTNPDNMTIGGTLRITDETGIFSEAPLFANGSTLQYASITGGYSRGGEWGTVGDRRPFHVQVSDNNTFILAGGDSTTPREMRGNLTIDAGSTFAEGILNGDFTVNGNVVVSGELILSSGLGNLRIGGNYTKQAGGTFNNSGSSVYFQGGTTQSMFGVMNGGVLNRFYRILVINNSTVTFNNDVGVVNGLFVESGSTFQRNGTANFEQEATTGTSFPPVDVLECDGTCIFNNVIVREINAGNSTGAIDINGNFTLQTNGTDFIAPAAGAFFNIGGNFVSNLTAIGSFTANGGTINFDATGIQNLTVNNIPITFNILSVASTSTLIETVTADNVIATTVINNGIIRKNRTISAVGVLSFGLTDVDFNINSFTGTPTITVDRHDTDHPNATSGIGSSSQKYWDITATGGGTFDVNVTFADNTLVGFGTQRTCRKDAGPWQCQDDDDGDNGNFSTTRNNVTAFSSWQNCIACGPTALTLSKFSSVSEGSWNFFLLVVAVFFLGIVLLFGILLFIGKSSSEALDTG